MCGYLRKLIQPPTHTPIAIDLTTIDVRLSFLEQSIQSTSYSKQKQSLQDELETFLRALPAQKSLLTATPSDICRFLIWKDRHGKTQVHCNGCPHLGKHGVSACSCPRRLAYSTIDSYIGKLRAILHSAGRQGEWASAFSLGKPAAAVQVKHYLKAVTAEQLQARKTPKQANPLFLPKLHTHARHITSKMQSTDISASALYILARDQAVLKTLFFGGDRASDLGNVKTSEILRFPSDDGLLFNHVWGKTLRDGSSNMFGIRRHPNSLVCPVAAIELYVAVCHQLQIDLSRGYLFRPTTPQGDVIDKPLLSSTMQQRLKLYLQEARVDAGESLHSLRAGCAITLAFSGSPLADVMGHVGWKADHTALYYMKLSEVLRHGAPSQLLSAEPVETQTSVKTYQDLNLLKNFVCAFPPFSDKRSPQPS